MIKTLSEFSGATAFWLGIGLIAQSCFLLRFLIQWIISERQAQSVIPISFWYLSICGALGLLSYALYRHDPIFILGQSMSLFVYTRNLILIKKQG